MPTSLSSALLALALAASPQADPPATAAPENTASSAGPSSGTATTDDDDEASSPVDDAENAAASEATAPGGDGARADDAPSGDAPAGDAPAEDAPAEDAPAEDDDGDQAGASADAPSQAKPNDAAAPDAASTRATERPRVLILDLTAKSAPEELAGVVTSQVANRLSREPGLEVISVDDLRRIIELEAERQMVGCTTESCLAEVAGAMGAQYVVFGEITGVGGLLVTDLRLFDALEAKPVVRTSLKVRTEAEVLEKLPQLTDPILVGLGVTPSAPDEEPGLNLWWLGGGGAIAALGLAAMATGLAVAGVGQLLLYTPGSGGAVKTVTWVSLLPALAVAVIGGAAVAGGGGVLAWALVAE